MKKLLLVSLLGLLSGCALEQRSFKNAMVRYEADCEAQMRIYESGDAPSARSALQQIIARSLLERERATRYWRFNLLIAMSYARLAVIAEAEGRFHEANIFFEKASDFQIEQDRAWREEGRRIPNVTVANEVSNIYVRATPEEWRHTIKALESELNIRWKTPNQASEPTALLGRGSP